MRNHQKLVDNEITDKEFGEVIPRRAASLSSTDQVFAVFFTSAGIDIP
jgi:hypothetical protein